jgi:hypothetical protein
MTCQQVLPLVHQKAVVLSSLKMTVFQMLWQPLRQLSGYSVARMHQALLSPMLSIQQTVSYHLSLLHAPAYWQHILKLLHNIHIFVEQYCFVTITEHPAYLLACLLKLGFITCMRQQHRLNDIPKATATFTQE